MSAFRVSVPSTRATCASAVCKKPGDDLTWYKPTILTVANLEACVQECKDHFNAYCGPPADSTCYWMKSRTGCGMLAFTAQTAGPNSLQLNNCKLVDKSRDQAVPTACYGIGWKAQQIEGDGVCQSDGGTYETRPGSGPDAGLYQVEPQRFPFIPYPTETEDTCAGKFMHTDCEMEHTIEQMERWPSIRIQSGGCTNYCKDKPCDGVTCKAYQLQSVMLAEDNDLRCQCLPSYEATCNTVWMLNGVTIDEYNNCTKPGIDSPVSGDPHVNFAHGGSADFRGEDGGLISFFTAPGLALNVKTEDSTFTPPWWPNTTIDGSYITEAPLAHTHPTPLVKPASPKGRCLRARPTSSRKWAAPSASGPTSPSWPRGSISTTPRSTSSPAPAAATPSLLGSGQSYDDARSCRSNRATQAQNSRPPPPTPDEHQSTTVSVLNPPPPPTYTPGARLDL